MAFNNAIDRLIAQIPNNLSEIEKARYVYLELGKLLCYDEKYWFGNSEIKNRIYKKSLLSTPSFSEIQENKKKKAICISISKLYSSVLQEIGIKSGQQKENDHFYTYFFIKDKLFYADLNNDMKYIQLDLPTSYFCIEGTNVLSKEQLLKIDDKLGFYYKGLDNLKNKINLIKSKFKGLNTLSDKMQCIFDLGSEIPGVKDLELIERNFIYRRLALQTLSDKEFDRVQSLQFYEVQTDEKKFNNRVNYQTVYVTKDFDRNSKKDIFSYFVFSQDDRKFKKVTPVGLLNFIEKNNLNFQKIPGLIKSPQEYEEMKKIITGICSEKNINNGNTNKKYNNIDDTLIK